MIQAHVYAKRSATPVFVSPVGDEHPVHLLNQGSWIGVLERKGEWIRMIGIDGEGWVKSEDTEERSPFTLHALWSPGKPIEYSSSASSDR